MGWRTVEFRIDNPGDLSCLTLLEQLADFGEFHGCRPDFEKTGSPNDGGWVLFTLDGNSMWLNDFTPIFIEGCREIAADIDGDSDDLNGMVFQIESQLTDQLVPLHGDGIITEARPGREALERVGGESSSAALIEEIELHADRVRDSLSRLRSVSGADGWRQRIRFRQTAAIDARAVIHTARRLIRVARHMCDTFPGEHLKIAYARFMEDTLGLIDLRDIAEHIDEYAVGRGRRDAAGEQPGPVFEYLAIEDDVVVTARGHSLGVLAAAESAFRLGRCLGAAAEKHFPLVLFPDGLDFDFMERMRDGSLVYVDRGEESSEQREVRATWEATRPRTPTLDAEGEAPTLCPECGEPL